MTVEAPTAFMSHSSNDNGFCDALYEALRRHGIRVILDIRDFQPGDDLIKRIFDEGIGQSDAVIFVLSPESVNKPWLQKELSVSVVHSITERTRLIPVLVNGLPDNDVPIVLAATHWIRIAEGHDTVDSAAQKIANVMYGDRPNPVIAPAPKWTQEAVSKISRLTAQDEIIFKFVCEQMLETHLPFVGGPAVSAYAGSMQIPLTELPTILAVLHDHYYIEKPRGDISRRPNVFVQPTTLGLSVYLQNYRAEEYATAFRRAVAAINNGVARDILSLVAAASTTIGMANHIVHVLHDEGDIIALWSMGGVVTWNVMPTLRRRL